MIDLYSFKVPCPPAKVPVVREEINVGAERHGHSFLIIRAEFKEGTWRVSTWDGAARIAYLYLSRHFPEFFLRKADFWNWRGGNIYESARRQLEKMKITDPSHYRLTEGIRVSAGNEEPIRIYLLSDLLDESKQIEPLYDLLTDAQKLRRTRALCVLQRLGG